MTKVLALSTLLIIGGSAIAGAADRQQFSGGAITADKMEVKTDRTISWSGHVTVVAPTFGLVADSVEVRDVGTVADATAELTARGNVVLTRGQERITLKELTLNVVTGAGTFQLPPAKK